MDTSPRELASWVSLGKRNQAFNRVHVSDWVRQFKPEFAEYALRTAESVQLIGRACSRTQAINAFFKQSLEGFSLDEARHLCRWVGLNTRRIHSRVLFAHSSGP